MKYALDREGKLVSINDVSRGYACNCICPNCKKDLNARKGDSNTWVFAHRKGEGCGFGYQTSLHYLAKEIIEEGCKIKLPQPLLLKTFDEFNSCLAPGHTQSFLVYGDDEYELMGKEYSEVWNSRLLKEYGFLDTKDSQVSVTLEKMDGDIIPDVTVIKKVRKGDSIVAHKLFIEIYVTHKVDEEKRKKIASSGISTVEFDLHMIDRDDITKDKLREIFENGECCRWVYNSKAEKLVNGIFEKRELKKKEQQIKYGGYTKKYRIYRRDKDRGYYYEGDLDYREFVIYKPPCGGMETRDKNRILAIESCSEDCPFFQGIEHEDIKADEYSNKTESFILCNLKPR